MALFIEPGTTTVEVDGEKVEVKILTGSERVKLQREMLAVYRLFEGKEPGERLTHEETLDAQDAYFRALKIGLKTDPDTILPDKWESIVTEVIKANEVDGDDAKN